MAIEKKYTCQMPFVGTLTQCEKIVEVAERENVSKAHVVRLALDAYFDLIDGEERLAQRQ